MQHIDAEQLEEEKRKLKERDKVKAGSAISGCAVGASRNLNRANLANVRVVQPNLVYAVGLPLDICDEEILRQNEFFGQYGKTVKISVNRSNQYASALAKHGPTGSAYVTFRRSEDALRCIKSLDGSNWRDKPIKACFGTTKYCNAFLKGVPCNNPECLYLHELADEGDCLTKEEVAAGLLPARFLAMGATNTFRPRLTINSIPNAATAAAQAAAAAAVAAGQPRAAIEAAAAAAGGVDRAQYQPTSGTQSTAPTTTRILTIPASSLRASTSNKTSQMQQGWQQQNDGYSSAASSDSGTSPNRGQSEVIAIPAPPPKSQWRPVGGSESHGSDQFLSSTAVIPPPPPSDKQEWPTLAPGKVETSRTSIDKDASPAQNKGEIGRAMSMAEQLAKSHSTQSEPKPRTKKLVSLSSPGKMKPLGKAPSNVLRPMSPHDVNTVAGGNSREFLTTDDKAGRNTSENMENELETRSIETPREISANGGSDRRTILNPLRRTPSISSGEGSSMLRGPPPGFADRISGGAHQRHQTLKQPGQRQVAPPPGFTSLATSSRNSSFDSSGGPISSGGNDYIGKESGGFSQFDGLAGGATSLLNSLTLSGGSIASQQNVTLNINSLESSKPLQPEQGLKPASGPPTSFVPSLSRRRKSRFAFAQTEDDASGEGSRVNAQPDVGAVYDAGGNVGAQSQAFNSYTAGGMPLQTRLAGPPDKSVNLQTQSQKDNAGAFFKSLFPSANVTVLDQQQVGSGRQAGNFNLAASDLNGPFQGSTSFTMSQQPFNSNLIGPMDSHQQHESKINDISPGLALLRQLQGGERQNQFPK